MAMSASDPTVSCPGYAGSMCSTRSATGSSSSRPELRFPARHRPGLRTSWKCRPHTGRVLRPDPLRWLWYSFGGGLPPRYREWVLHDVTTRSWALRQALRSLLMVAPLVVLVLV